jgi:hypothetical protein
MGERLCNSPHNTTARSSGRQIQAGETAVVLVIFALLIYITPQPLLSQFGRADDGVPRFFIVMACMLIARRITAQHFAAGLANAEMHPLTVDPNALLTTKHWIV